ncbi:MAG: ABC transporter ATP-binding protein [Clostridia bacterium]|nr:ABC transporter ATP-binding protein [Clostridia bacterium]
MQNEHTPILTVRELSRNYPEPEKNRLFSRAMNHAVQRVSFELYRGETLGIVGESGCGKSTVARMVMGLEKPDAGSVFFHDTRIDQLPERSLRSLRPRFQMVFQDSGSSLNGRKRVVDILREPMLYHRIVAKDKVDARIDALLDMVGLSPSAKLRYPHEFSGGQRQRICIAKALSLDPELIILDEPVSALDVSVQAQILNLLRDLQEKLGVSYLFIGHGLGAVHYISHRIAVMYRGRIVETGDSQELFRHPVHPYTRALLDAAPLADYDARNRERIVLRGEIGHTDWTEGCAFRRRCPYATSQCAHASCTMTAAGRPGHLSVCMAGTQERGE